MEKKRVGIIGAGVSGLVTAKVFLAQGHSVVVFEQLETLGGVWSPERHYPGLRLQTKRQCYAFSDAPMPDHYPEFPTGQQLYDYLSAYAARFGVDRCIRFRTAVTAVTRHPDGRPGRRLRVRDLAHGGETEEDFDFVVVCAGLFSKPLLANIPGRDEFEADGGVVLHSSQVRDTAPLAGRDVAVVGFGKSALDIAEAAATAGRSSTLVFRRGVWKFPHRIWGRANIKHFILSRWSEIWFPHPQMSAARAFLHRWLSPLVDLYWFIAERVIGRQLGLFSKDLRPDVPLRKGVLCLTLSIDDLKSIHEGRIALRRGAVKRFTRAGLELEDGRVVAAQIVVLATGFRQDWDLLEARERAALFDRSGAIMLYRFLINPDLPDIAFNGYNGVGPCQLTAEVGANWLVRLMEGRLALPDRETMLASIRAEDALRQSLVEVKPGAGYYVTPFPFAYLDQLLRDLGLPPADRHKRLIAWLFDPLDPADYRDLLEKADAAKERARPAPARSPAERQGVQDVH